MILELTNLNINGDEHSMTITNMGGNLSLGFKGFEIFIMNGKLRIRKTIYRPNHDHDDIEDVVLIPCEFGPARVDY